MHGSSKPTLTSASSCTKSLWGSTAAAVGPAALLVDHLLNIHHVLCHFVTSPSSEGQAAVVDDPGAGTVDMPDNPQHGRRLWFCAECNLHLCRTGEEDGSDCFLLYHTRYVTLD